MEITEFHCAAPFGNVEAKDKCKNPVYTELRIRCVETGEEYHFLWFCREHSGTDKETIIANGENHEFKGEN